jgi:glycosyltransferase involved in cell wall biosynthesis/ubiquinone/menaquinone biosynthesis C-methylase UbiE
METKQQKIAYFDALAPTRDWWKRKSSYYYRNLQQCISFLIPEGQSVLEIGCGTGDVLAALKPSRGVGIDISPQMIDESKKKFPPDTFSNLEFVVDDIEELRLSQPFKYVLLSDCVGELTDVWLAFRNVKKVITNDSRVVITSYNSLWEPILKFAEKIGYKAPQSHQNWFTVADVDNLLQLNGLEVIKYDYHLLLPKYVPVLSWLANAVLAKLPLVKKLCLFYTIVARPNSIEVTTDERSVSVIVPCRNEKGNILAAVERIPEMGKGTEIIFVDGNSSDGTVEEIEKAIAAYRHEKNIRLIHQVPRLPENSASSQRMLPLGKGDAVRKGFAAANGDILMILDADLTVPPEDLPKFYLAVIEGRGDLINGTRLVYPMEKDSMRFLNKIANHLFSLLFTWILNQRIKDTLCGTKVILRENYRLIERNRDFFGDFDPFGDFDLLFGAAKQHLKIVEIPIKYRERVCGEIKIERFKHGLLLLKMSLLALKKFKFT